MLYVLPTAIQHQADNGIGNMGSLSDDTSKARFGLTDQRWCFLWARIHFTDLTGSASSSTADCTISVDSRLGSRYDAALHVLRALSKTTDGFVRIDSEELDEWTFEPADRLVFVWSNPDSGNIGWGIEVGLAPASAVVGG